MREIVFRGKRIDNGEWVEGHLAAHDLIAPDYPEDTYNATGEYCGQTPYVGFIGVHPATIGQYTGMRDSNGRQIFEGDILFFDYIGENLGVRGKATVVFQEGKFGVLWGYRKELVALDGFANVMVEVIGNIYDNNELLEGIL